MSAKKRKQGGGEVIEPNANNNGTTPKKIKTEEFVAVTQNKSNTPKNNNTKKSNTPKKNNNTPTKTTPKKKKNNKKKKKNNNTSDREPATTRAVTTELFSELTTENTDVPFSNPFELPKQFQDNEQGVAWIDEDDEVMVSTRKQLRSEDIKVSGHEYQEKLRKRHQAQAVQSADWAKIKKKKSDKFAILGGEFENSDDSENSDSDDDGDAMLYRSQPLTMPSSRLITTSIDVLSNPIVQHHQSGVRRVSIHPVEPIAMSVDGNTLKVYRLGEKMVLMHSVKMVDMDITDACFTVDGSQIFLCGNQPSLYILEVSSGKLSFLSKILGRKEKGFSRIYASPNEKHCALLGTSGSIILISTLTKQFVGELRGPSNSVYCATFAPDGRLFASYAGGVMIVWDIVARTAVHSFSNPSLTFSTAIAISPDEKYLVLGSNVGIVDVFLMKDLVPGGPQIPPAKVSLDNLITSISFIKFNHDSQLMAMGTDGKKQGLRLVHLPTFSVYQNWPLETTFNLIKDASFSPASGFLLTGENIGKVKMFRLPHFPAA